MPYRHTVVEAEAIAAQTAELKANEDIEKAVSKMVQRAVKAGSKIPVGDLTRKFRTAMTRFKGKKESFDFDATLAQIEKGEL